MSREIYLYFSNFNYIVTFFSIKSKTAKAQIHLPKEQTFSQCAEIL